MCLHWLSGAEVFLLAGNMLLTLGTPCSCPFTYTHTHTLTQIDKRWIISHTAPNEQTQGRRVVTDQQQYRNGRRCCFVLLPLFPILYPPHLLLLFPFFSLGIYFGNPLTPHLSFFCFPLSSCLLASYGQYSIFSISTPPPLLYLFTNSMRPVAVKICVLQYLFKGK